MNGNELVDVVADRHDGVYNLLRGHALISELSRLDSDKTLAKAGVDGVYADDSSVGIILEDSLCLYLANVYRAGKLAGAGDINDIVALFKLSSEILLEFSGRNHGGGVALAASHNVVKISGIDVVPVKICGSFHAVLNGIHHHVINVVLFAELLGEIRAGIGDDFNRSHCALLLF